MQYGESRSHLLAGLRVPIVEGLPLTYAFDAVLRLETFRFYDDHRQVLHVPTRVLGGEATMLWPTRISMRTGDYFGELGVLGGRPYSLHVVAEKHLHLMKLPSQQVLELARRHPPVTLKLLKDLGVRLRPAAAG